MNKVARNIIRRSEERSRGESAKAIKTALVVTGGGTRAITSCAAAAALTRLGLHNAFDSIYAVSSGALNAAYFLSNQISLGLSVYLEDIGSPRFVSYRRWPHIMDLDYLFDEIVSHKKKCDFEAIMRHPTLLNLVTTESRTGRARWFTNKAPRR